jgi:hypothetical protein
MMVRNGNGLGWSGLGKGGCRTLEGGYNKENIVEGMK